MLLSWAIIEVRAHIDQLPPLPDAPVAPATDLTAAIRKENNLAEFRGVAIVLRKHMGAILELQRMQVPFPYFHMINLLLLVNLILVA